MKQTGYLGSIIDLFRDLNAEGVQYCHWKSNYKLDRSLCGLTDLDILIDREHGEQFRLILNQHGLKSFVSPLSKSYLGIEDYLGFDKDTGNLFHLHVHYQLILGEHFVKNYRFPIEKILLDNTMVYKGIIKIPLPELEIIVLVVRALLKYRDRDAIKDIFSIRSSGIPVPIQDELKYLYDRTDLQSVSRSLQHELNTFPNLPILDFISVVTNNPRSGFLFYRLRRQLLHALTPYQLRSRWRASCEYFGILLRRRMYFLPRYSDKKIPLAGGMMVGVIGADGAGKSTIVNELLEWLSWKMDVCRIYLGSQEPSQRSKITHFIYRVCRSIQTRWINFVGKDRIFTKVLDNIQQLWHNAYHLSIASDRERRYATGRNQSLKGKIVICDRYPLDALHKIMLENPMDGPRVSSELGEKVKGRLERMMSKVELQYYQRIRPPDHIFLLHVSPQISFQRKPDHDRDVIEIKSQSLRLMDKQELQLTEIDADQEFDQVLLQIKTELWNLL